MKRIKCIVSLVLAMTMVIIMSFSATPVMATENNVIVSDDTQTMIPLEETEYTREEAIEILGISKEDAKNMSFYVVDVEPAENLNIDNGISTCGVSISPGENHAFPTFTFTGKNVGSYWTCKGTKLTWSAIHHSSANSNNSIAIFLYGYGKEDPNDVFAGCTGCVVDLPAGSTYRSGSFTPATKNYDYHFVYYGGNQSKVTMIVGII